MGQRTLYKKDFLRIAEDYDEPGGDVLWISDELDEVEVSLSREQLTEVLPILQGWLGRENVAAPRAFSLCPDNDCGQDSTRPVGAPCPQCGTRLSALRF